MSALRVAVWTRKKVDKRGGPMEILIAIDRAGRELIEKGLRSLPGCLKGIV